MKALDERKDFLRRLQLAASNADDMLTSCDASDILDCLENSRDYMFEAACMIEQLESQLAQVEMEKKAAIHDCAMFPCRTCTDLENKDLCAICRVKNSSYRSSHEWRGVCEENIKEE